MGRVVWFLRGAHTNKIIGARFFYYGLSRIQDTYELSTQRAGEHSLGPRCHCSCRYWRRQLQHLNLHRAGRSSDDAPVPFLWTLSLSLDPFTLLSSSLLCSENLRMSNGAHCSHYFRASCCRCRVDQPVNRSRVLLLQLLFLAGESFSTTLCDRTWLIGGNVGDCRGYAEKIVFCWFCEEAGIMVKTDLGFGICWVRVGDEPKEINVICEWNRFGKQWGLYQRREWYWSVPATGLWRAPFEIALPPFLQLVSVSP
jgi:hypothetical protein